MPQPEVREDEERAAIAALETALGEKLVAAKWDPAPVDAPRELHWGARSVAWAGTAARIRDELAGIARAPSHPATPKVIASVGRAIALEPIAREDGDAIEALIAGVPRTIQRLEATVREHLVAIGGPIAVARALGRILGRSKTDRLLARRLTIATGVGPILGGIDPRWLRRSVEGRTISLSMRHARESGWAAIDLAGADALGLADLRDAHRGTDVGDDASAADAAYDLALLALLAREAVMGRGEPAESAAQRAKEIAERFAPPRELDRVRVRVHAPEWLPVDRWQGDAVPISEARWALRELDGMALGGTILRVEVEPPIRAGRAVPRWRPREERRRELFSLWARGVRYEDEGLFSATPEALAEQIARDAKGVVIDGTCGIGSIAIALAKRPEVREVIAVDRDEGRLAMAKHNAGVYGVGSKIRFVLGDVKDVVRKEKASALYLDPPWGGRDYDRQHLTLGDLGLDVRPLLASFAGPVVLKLPRSLDVASPELAGFSIEAGVDARGVIKLLIARRG